MLGIGPSWEDVFLEGFAPRMSEAALLALRDALRGDSPCLTQGRTTYPDGRSLRAPCEAGCLIAYAGWKGEGLVSVSQVLAYFDSLCHGADYEMRNPGACDALLSWWDRTPRGVARPLMLGAVEAALSRLERKAG